MHPVDSDEMAGHPVPYRHQVTEHDSLALIKKLSRRRRK
jgi:hypothetical protein